MHVFVTFVCDAGQIGFQIHTAPTRQHTPWTHKCPCCPAAPCRHTESSQHDHEAYNKRKTICCGQHATSIKGQSTLHIFPNYCCRHQNYCCRHQNHWYTVSKKNDFRIIDVATIRRWFSCIFVCPRVALTHMCNSEAHTTRQLYPLLYRRSICMIDHIPILQFQANEKTRHNLHEWKTLKNHNILGRPKPWFWGWFGGRG